jgi:hypothetical protein
MLTQRWLLAGTTGAAAFLLASCGGRAGDVATTADQETGQAAAIAVAEGKGGGAELFAAMLAAQEEAGSYRFEMDMDIEGASYDAPGAAEYGTDIDQVDMTMTMSMPLDDLDPDAGNGQLEMLLVDGQIYMSFPPELGLPVDKPWLTVDPEGGDPISQAFGAMSEQMVDSAALQRKLAEQAELIAVEELGSDTADGVAVTKYRITLSADDLVEFMEIPGTEGMSAENAPFDEAEYTLWLDSGFLLRKLEAGLDGLKYMDMRFFGFGEPVDVEAPPADQVTDFASLVEGMGTVDG